MIAIDANHLAGIANDLRGDVAEFTATGSQVENRVSLTDVACGISAAVVLLDDLIRQLPEQFWLVGYGAAKCLLAILRSCGVTFGDGLIRSCSGCN